MEEQRKIKCNKRCMKIWAKVLQIVGACLLVVLGITRFFFGGITHPVQFMLSIYYFFFAAILILGEIQLQYFMRYMTFLYYSWGKALLDFFIGSLCFSTEINPFLQIPVGLLFIAASILFTVLAVFTWKKDRMKA